MCPEERLGVACLSYQRALAKARRGSSPASWRGLLTAARNLSAARRDHERARGRAVPQAGPALPPRLAPVVELQRRVALIRSRELWAQLTHELTRSKDLMAQARELVQAARATSDREPDEVQ